MQKHQSRHFQESQEEHPEVFIPEGKEGTAWPKQRLQAQPTGLSETKGNLDSAVSVGRVRTVGWTEKSLSPMKAEYAKGKAGSHQEI